MHQGLGIHTRGRPALSTSTGKNMTNSFAECGDAPRTGRPSKSPWTIRCFCHGMYEMDSDIVTHSYYSLQQCQINSSDNPISEHRWRGAYHVQIVATVRHTKSPVTCLAIKSVQPYPATAFVLILRVCAHFASRQKQERPYSGIFPTHWSPVATKVIFS